MALRLGVPYEFTVNYSPRITKFSVAEDTSISIHFQVLSGDAKAFVSLERPVFDVLKSTVTNNVAEVSSTQGFVLDKKDKSFAVRRSYYLTFVPQVASRVSFTVKKKNDYLRLSENRPQKVHIEE